MKERVKMKMRGLLVSVLGLGAMSYLLHILEVMVPVYYHAGGNGGKVFVHLSCIVWCCISLTCLCGLIVIVVRGKKTKEEEKESV